jgi:hypothetical protein
VIEIERRWSWDFLRRGADDAREHQEQSNSDAC